MVAKTRERGRTKNGELSFALLSAASLSCLQTRTIGCFPTASCLVTPILTRSCQPPSLPLLHRRKVLPVLVSATARRTPRAGGVARSPSTCRRRCARVAVTLRRRCDDVSVRPAQASPGFDCFCKSRGDPDLSAAAAAERD